MGSSTHRVALLLGPLGCTVDVTATQVLPPPDTSGTRMMPVCDAPATGDHAPNGRPGAALRTVYFVDGCRSLGVNTRLVAPKRTGAGDDRLSSGAQP